MVGRTSYTPLLRLDFKSFETLGKEQKRSVGDCGSDLKTIPMSFLPQVGRLGFPFGAETGPS